MRVVWLAAVIGLLIPVTAAAGYPMITDLANQEIQMNSSTPVIHFSVSDDTTPPDQLLVDVRSDNTSLIPADSEHIILGGAGQDRTIQVIPLQDAWGTATITIIVTDRDGDKARDSFEVEVNREPPS